ncbi:MAG TPA: hypothetical protein VEG68_11440 [Terriglobales bacterium]|nr:hypothetical protein [Terriglobales bacterium]
MAVLYFCFPTVKPASGQGFQPTSPEKESIRGTVVNSVTHEAIGRALVFSPDNRFATMTDSEGHFEFTFSTPSTTQEGTGTESVVRINPAPDLPDTLMARKPGFLDDRNTRVSTRSAAGKDLTISLTPEALIVGHVLLPSSDDSDRIEVELYRRQVREGRAHWISTGMATSRSNGEFRFADLSAGNYKVLTRELLDRDPLTFDPRGPLYGYPPVYFPNAASFASAETIQLSPGETFHANITVVRHAYYQVKVGAAGAEPGVGMNVTVYAEGRGPGYALGYNNQEQAIMGMLPDGNYTVEAATYGPNPTTGLLNFSVKGAAVEGPGMILVHNGSVGVNVREEFTQGEATGPQSVGLIKFSGGGSGLPQGPRRYLNIYLEPADDFSIEQGASLRGPSGPEDESLVIDNVRPGRYWVRINSSRGFAASVTCGGIDLQRQPLVIGLGGSTSPIEVTMRDDGAEIEGTVEGMAKPVSEAGASQPQTWLQPELQAHVYLVPAPDSSGEFREAWVSPEGKFTLQQVPPGVYRVLAFDRAQPELEYRNADAMRAYESKGQAVSLVAGQKQQLQLQMISTSE